MGAVSDSDIPCVVSRGFFEDPGLVAMYLAEDVEIWRAAHTGLYTYGIAHTEAVLAEMQLSKKLSESHKK
jgi:hypothetical protein